MNIIKYRKIFYAISGTVFVSSIAVLTIFGLPLGIDFRGGSLLEMEFVGGIPSMSDIESEVHALALGEVILQQTSSASVLLRLRDLSEEEHQRVLKVLGGIAGMEGVREKRFESIGPTIGAELERRAGFAIVLALLAIVFYIAWAFRKVSRPISSWKYSLIAIVALLHDVTIPAGIFAFLGQVRGIEIDALFISAILTILGFSVHDTIVVFDRVRENLAKFLNRPFEEIVAKSVSETLMRSLNTSFTTLFVLMAVFIFGGETVRYLALALSLGIFFGTYSSIFIASSLLVTWEQWHSKSTNRKNRSRGSIEAR